MGVLVSFFARIANFAAIDGCPDSADSALGLEVSSKLEPVRLSHGPLDLHKNAFLIKSVGNEPKDQDEAYGIQQ